MTPTPHHPRRAKLRLGAALLPALLAGSFLVANCGHNTPATQPPAHPENVLLTIDGVDITLDEVNPHVQFLANLSPELSKKVVFRSVLEEFTIPLRFAQRKFAEQRAKLLARATDLRSVADNAIELEKRGELLVIKRKGLARRGLELPVAEFLFDPLTTGSVSQPIEVPRGYIVASAYGIEQGAQVINDLVDAVQVGFLTHSPLEWGNWWESERVRLAGKVTYVKPGYSEFLPEWIKLP